VLNLLAEVGLGCLLHLNEDHGGDLLRGKALGLALEGNLNVGLAVLGNHLEREVLEIGLKVGVVHFAADQTLRIKHGVLRVHGGLVLGSVTDETLSVGEGNP
jgi:hypothetical protein